MAKFSSTILFTMLSILSSVAPAEGRIAKNYFIRDPKDNKYVLQTMEDDFSLPQRFMSNMLARYWGADLDWQFYPMKNQIIPELSKLLVPLCKSTSESGSYHAAALYSISEKFDAKFSDDFAAHLNQVCSESGLDYELFLKLMSITGAGIILYTALKFAYAKLFFTFQNPLQKGPTVVDSLEGKLATLKIEAIEFPHIISVIGEVSKNLANFKEEHLCPISYDLMKHPATLSSGHTYDLENIQAWLERRQTCPNTGKEVDNRARNLKVNIFHHNLIRDGITKFQIRVADLENELEIAKQMQEDCVGDTASMKNA